MIRKIGSLALVLCLTFFGLQYYMQHHHDVPYELKKVYITLPHLPDEFDGLTIGHLSDIHCGNFKNEKELEEGIDLLMKQKPDLVFITGDVIEGKIEEIVPYAEMLGRIKAQEGVFLSLGNHDYGFPYRHDAQYLEKIKKVGASLGWQLLLNEHRMLKRGDQAIAIIGVENYSTGVFPRYGDIAKALKGTEDAPVRLLLSHDPSHWEAQIVDAEPPVDVTFSGHTHGIKFLVSGGKGNPIHVYPQYKGLYQKEGRYIYVSTGIGNTKEFGRPLRKREVTLVILQKG